ncbi:PspC domain-containing protein [Nonomuraea wenchangensis]|uniref:PspC domain-containing protein n=2 Tax=Nonomuraea wenchangensis TaxID=568860 RepID=A0A1I0LFP2_9ACTN|nr:PspC domain-containing protein [Nonomuraea wenchangensis]
MGVCAGLGRHTGIDPVVFRVAFAVLLLGSGVGLFLYIAAFLLMKEPNGSPGIIEQWTRRDFDAETVLALLTAVLGVGLGLNLATIWIDAGTLVVGVFLAVSLLAAHANGVDLLGLARSMPERLRQRPRAGQPAPTYASPQPTPPVRHAPHPTPTMPSAPAAHFTPATQAAPTAPPANTANSANTVGAPATEPRVDEVGVDDAVTAEHPVPPHEPAAHETGDGTTAQEAAHEAGHETAGPQAAGQQTAGHQAAGHQTAEHQTAGPQAAGRWLPEDEDQDESAAYRPRTAVAYGEPFAPKGPYRPLDPARRAGDYSSPYDPALYTRPTPRRPQRAPRPKSFIGVITILLAIIIGGIVVAVQTRSAAGVSPTIVGGAMLITIGAGLLVATWWGRGAGLVAAGVAVALAVSAGLALGGLPRNFGPSEWAPSTLSELASVPVYDVGAGQGLLDLSELKLPPGTTASVEARISMGELEVIVPPTVRLEVHASNRVGDIRIDQRIHGGVNVRVNQVLEPETKPEGKVSTIVLDLKGGLGDMEVRRGA